MMDFAWNIVETVRHPLLVLDAEYRIVKANAAFYGNFDLIPSATKGQDLFGIVGGQWNIPLLRTQLDAIMPEGSFEDLEIRHDFSQLGRRILLLNARQIRQDNGMAMILLAIEDVTDKVRAWDELHKSNRDLEIRVKERTEELLVTNRELEAFCYSVSHDLRAPLRALDGFSAELLRSYAELLDDKGRHYLERLRSGTKRMGQLIDDLLQLSRHSRGEMKWEQVDLTNLAQSIAAELRLREPSREVSFDIQPNINVHGDEGLLKIVLENLLENAWKFSRKSLKSTIAFGQADFKGFPAFFVRDDGTGFDMSHATKLFGAFQRMHSQKEFPGTGIGLATVQRIVHRHGGQVWAESSLGKGASFYFTIPNKDNS